MCNRQPNLYNLSVSAEPDSGEQALQRLVGGDITQEKLASSMEAIFSSREAIDAVSNLQKSDARAFIDAVDKVWCRLPPLRNGV